MDYSQKYKKIFATRPRDEPPRGTPGSHHGRVLGVASEPYTLQVAVISYSCPVPFFTL